MALHVEVCAGAAGRASGCTAPRGPARASGSTPTPLRRIAATSARASRGHHHRLRRRRGPRVGACPARASASRATGRSERRRGAGSSTTSAHRRRSGQPGVRLRKRPRLVISARCRRSSRRSRARTAHRPHAGNDFGVPQNRAPLRGGFRRAGPRALPLCRRRTNLGQTSFAAVVAPRCAGAGVVHW